MRVKLIKIKCFVLDQKMNLHDVITINWIELLGKIKKMCLHMILYLLDHS